MDISTIIFAAALASATPGSSGDKEISVALIRYTKADTFARTLEHKYVDPDTRKHAGWALIVLKSATERRISIRFSFP